MRHHYVLCIKNDGYDVSLEPRKLYESVPDSDAEKHDQIRIIDESGEDYLYPRSLFKEIKISKEIENAISRAA